MTFRSYISLTLSTTFQITRSAAETQFICSRNFSKYVEPLKSGLVKESETGKLWRCFEPHLRKSLDHVALKGSSLNSGLDELPFCARYLLISAYLASYNSTKSDKRFFVKYQGHSKGRRITLAKNDKMCAGPKPFPLERLLHIFRALLDLNSDAPTTSGENSRRLQDVGSQVLMQLENLTALSLLSRMGTNTTSCLSSARKWRVSDALTLDYMLRVAKSVHFDLMAHLEHFAYKR